MQAAEIGLAVTREGKLVEQIALKEPAAAGLDQECQDLMSDAAGQHCNDAPLSRSQ